jgi:WD40 repeat protein
MGPARRLSTLAGLFLAAGLFAFPKLPAVDRHGDPLPPGAVGRLGTVQLRAGCEIVSFSADGKTLIGVDREAVRVWDADSGRPVDVRRHPSWMLLFAASSGDGHTLAVPTDNSVELWDVPSVKRLDVPLPKHGGRIIPHAVSNDRRWIVLSNRVGHHMDPLPGGVIIDQSIDDVLLWDAKTTRSRTLIEGETGSVRVQISPDGTHVVAGRDSSLSVWEAATGHRLWSISDCSTGEIRFTSDGKRLIAAPAFGRTDWRAWNARSGEPITSLRLPAMSGRTFAVAPDGNCLLISGTDEYVVWDLKAGQIRHRWPVANRLGQGTFARDGRSVVTYDTVLRRWDLATGRNLYTDVSGLGHTGAVRELFFAPDGSRLLSIGDDNTARIWDVATSRLVRTLQGPDPSYYCTMTRDGMTLFGVDYQLTVHRWPLTSDGREATADLREAQASDTRPRVRDARISADGRLVLLTTPFRLPDNTDWFHISTWDPVTGRLVSERRVDNQITRGQPSPRLSADGRLAAGTEAVYDVKTGARQPLPGSPFGSDRQPLFSPDGRLLATKNNRDIRVWDTATGRAIIDLPAGSTDVAAFSPDGRWLVCEHGDRVIVWDVVARTAVTEWIAPKRSGPIGFSPDGRTVATGHSDGTILLWRVPAPAIEGRWSANEGAALWQDLGDETPGNAWTAVWQLADHPADAVRLLQGKYPLTPVAAADEFAKLIAGLDSPKFAEREKASRRLAELGRAAERPLRLALKASPTPEQAKRIESLLAAREPPTTRPRGEDLRAVRAVAVLEACATENARRLLADWAERGPPRLSDEAARAVERLKWQPVRP